MPPRRRTLPTVGEIRQAARATVDALAAYNLECCLFGSAACNLWGMSRRPNDVDMIVFTDMDTDDIKDLILAVDNRFYLVPSRDPNATYQVMWFALRSGRNCKVDILTPGILKIPDMPVDRIQYIEGFPELPVLPFVVLILLKLKGWTDHRDSDRAHYRRRQPVDEDDINEMLTLIPDVPEDEAGSLLEIESLDWMPDWFRQNGEARIAEFTEVFPDTSDAWNEMGFQGWWS